MTKEELDFLIQQGEGYNLEFKEGYNSSLAREICALANATNEYGTADQEIQQGD